MQAQGRYGVWAWPATDCASIATAQYQQHQLECIRSTYEFPRYQGVVAGQRCSTDDVFNKPASKIFLWCHSLAAQLHGGRRLQDVSCKRETKDEQGCRPAVKLKCISVETPKLHTSGIFINLTQENYTTSIRPFTTERTLVIAELWPESEFESARKAVEHLQPVTPPLASFLISTVMWLHHFWYKLAGKSSQLQQDSCSSLRRWECRRVQATYLGWIGTIEERDASDERVFLGKWFFSSRWTSL